jgi:hypothetical protein
VRYATLTPGAEKTLRRLVGAGHCNRCAARALGSNRGTVRHWRSRLGLPPVGSRGMSAACPTCVAGVRSRTAEQCRKAGVKTLAEVRVQAFAAYATENGYPSDLPPRCVQMLNALARAGGGMTRRQLASAIGLPWRGSRRSLKSGAPGGSYLATLQRAGLVVRVGKVRGVGKGCSVSVYTLSGKSLEILSRRTAS